MSADRRHTAVPEIGWLDFLDACRSNPIVRVEGKDLIATQARGRLTRFNRAVEIDLSTVDLGDEGPATSPRVHAYRVRRNPTTGEFTRTGDTMLVRWTELDWVSWQATGQPDGNRFKVTSTGRSAFGRFTIWERGERAAVYDEYTEKVIEFPNRAAAVRAIVHGGVK